MDRWGWRSLRELFGSTDESERGDSGDLSESPRPASELDPAAALGAESAPATDDGSVAVGAAGPTIEAMSTETAGVADEPDPPSAVGGSSIGEIAAEPAPADSAPVTAVETVADSSSSPTELVPAAVDPAECAQATPSSTTTQPAESPTEASVDDTSLVERASERILSDEGLRRNATDEEFQPLLDWALAAVATRVGETPGDFEPIVDQVRSILRAADAALGAEPAERAGVLADVAAHMSGPLFPDPAAVGQRVTELGGESPSDGVAFTNALAGVLRDAIEGSASGE
ncbi:MAG: hypothetical protein HY329_13485 [Chloroflexi bacterium]|nr:hypothetical protein [Chloroflexota bacterium]